MTLTDAEIAAIRERAELATRGPWLADTAGHLEIYSQHEDEPSLIFVFDWVPDKGIETDGYGHLQEMHPDLEFIAHSRTDIPALLETIEEMRGVIAAMVHDTAGWDIHGGDDYFVSADLIDRARALLEKMEREE